MRRPSGQGFRRLRAGEQGACRHRRSRVRVEERAVESALAADRAVERGRVAAGEVGPRRAAVRHEQRVADEGGVADHMVTQMLRQSDAEVFKLYSQAKLGMMREALAKLDRQANERGISGTANVN